MPLFKSNSVRQGTPPSPPTSPTRKRGLFSLSSPDRNDQSSTGSGRRSSDQNDGNRGFGGLFARKRSNSSSSDDGGHRSRKRFDRDPTVVAARQRVAAAETAEGEADRALNMARTAVKEAKDHVRRLELEAEGEAKRAKAKQAEAKVVRKSTRGLGRHG